MLAWRLMEALSLQYSSLVIASCVCKPKKRCQRCRWGTDEVKVRGARYLCEEWNKKVRGLFSPPAVRRPPCQKPKWIFPESLSFQSIINNAHHHLDHGAKEIYLSTSLPGMQRGDCHLLLSTMSYADMFSRMLPQAQNEGRNHWRVSLQWTA